MGSGASSAANARENEKKKKKVEGIPDWAQPKLNQAVILRRLDLDLGNVDDATTIKDHARRRKGQRARRRFAEQLPEGANGSFKHSVSKSELLASRMAVVEQPTLRKVKSASRKW